MKPHQLLLTAIPMAALALGAATGGAESRGWTIVVNNGDVMPGTADTLFNSYNQPSINADGLVVFRARSKGGGDEGGCGCGGDATIAADEGGGGDAGVTHGIYEHDMATSGTPIVRVFDRTSPIPAPNNTGATFNEFPSFPRIAMMTNMMATRGESPPVWQYTLPDGTDTQLGTSGIYMRGMAEPFTGMTQLGSVPGFEYWQVPDSPAGTRFDQFPGAPSPTQAAIVFKANWTGANGAGQTGVYYRTLSQTGGTSAVQVIADTSTLIPNQPRGGTARFGSAAPPSAANRKMVFLGLDNENDPTMGGIYIANLTPHPRLTTLVGIGDPVPGVPGETFSKIGEALSFDGRDASFWGAWGSETRDVILQCPTSGNKARVAYCKQQYPSGFTAQDPVNQAIFVTDTATHKTEMVAETGQDGYNDFLYWVFSGKVPGTGGGDFEPARWRSSAFTAVSAIRGSYEVAFKASKAGGTQGIYLAKGTTPSLAEHIVVVDTNTLGAQIDPDVNELDSATPLTVAAVGIERDGFRNQRLAIAIGMSNADRSVNWAGIYLAPPF